MRRSKASLVVLALLACAVGFVWCRGETEAPKKKKSPGPAAGAAKAAGPARPAPPKPASAGPAVGAPGNPVKSNVSKPGPAAAPNAPVALGGKNEGKTVDFSSGKPVITDTPEDKVAINTALKDFKEASKNVTFGPSKKKPEPAVKN